MKPGTSTLPGPPGAAWRRGRPRLPQPPGCCACAPSAPAAAGPPRSAPTGRAPQTAACAAAAQGNASPLLAGCLYPRYMPWYHFARLAQQPVAITPAASRSDACCMPSRVTADGLPSQLHATQKRTRRPPREHGCRPHLPALPFAPSPAGAAPLAGAAAGAAGAWNVWLAARKACTDSAVAGDTRPCLTCTTPNCYGAADDCNVQDGLHTPLPLQGTTLGDDLSFIGCSHMVPNQCALTLLLC